MVVPKLLELYSSAAERACVGILFGSAAGPIISVFYFLEMGILKCISPSSLGFGEK